MISFDTGSHHFNLRAAAVIFRGEHVLLHRADGDTFWTLPGGRVEPGEHAARTVIREMQEEVGVAICPEKTLCIVENFFTHNGQPNHELGIYIVASLEPGSPLLDLSATHLGSEQGKRLTFSWFSLQQLSDIDLRPIFLQRLLQAGDLSLAHVIQRESHFEISY
ncbi:NUDIX hydrolase [Ralstonia sp. 24A2]|uniref:NUDIX hydrolase n=1 Tax=Ralstonia sp. 24A2 TaxID=3447364 RepID=UPI003F69E3F1